MPRDTANGGIMEMFEGQPRDFDEGPGLLQSVWRYKWLIAIAALLGALLGYGWQARQPTVYEGSTRLLFSIGSGVLPGNSGAPPQDPKRFLSNQAEVITSRPVLERAAKAAGGRVSPRSLRGRMTVEIVNGADVIVIRVRDASPGGAARLARAVGTAYHEFTIDESSQVAAAEVKQLDATANEQKAQLDRLAVALQVDGDNPILQARQEAVVEQLKETVGQRERQAARAKNGVSPVQLHEPDPAPLQPVQPSPRRGAMAGLLLGLVGSAALAWWLSSRAAKQQLAEGERRHGSWAWPEEKAQRNPEPTATETAGAQRSDNLPAAGNGAPLGPLARLLRPRSMQAFLRPDAKGASGLDDRMAVADMPARDGQDDLWSILDRFEATLGGESLDWYLDNYPQLMAEQLTMRVDAELVAVLLDNGEGSFVVAGGFGLTAEEQEAIVPHSHDVVRQALAAGVGLFQDGTDMMPTAAAGLPGSQSTEALVMVPLVQRSSWVGMLVVGRRSANGHRVAAFSNQEAGQIIRYAAEIAPMLQTLLLLERLQGSVQSLKIVSDDHAEPASG
jgi:capsular polysaccharide biosynthesis protein